LRNETESGLTKAIAIIAMTGLLVAGAAATSILSRDSVPAATAAMAPTSMPAPVSNKEAKKDRLAVARIALASFEPAQTAIPSDTLGPSDTLNASDTLRQAFAAAAPADIDAVKATASVASAPALVAPPKPKPVAKPAAQKPYALLSDAQIAGIKERLKLSSDQEYYWPAVESALRAVARKIHATRRGDPNANGVPIDPDAAEVQQLKSAAMPLLFQLREDQKQEVRTLARLIGLEKVAAQI
jgi:hypothetical protein